ncbi:Hypothetical_protein [Hexamita inflata]|uniref:Hypothetical_protein n=1 Tax=Hexamita inflata TaxID=28002 RepID=A0AA86P8A0_9EUKA|nr:Hypothetical protein HINF_LOCUS20453 [Hexamita inflata]
MLSYSRALMKMASLHHTSLITKVLHEGTVATKQRLILLDLGGTYLTRLRAFQIPSYTKSVGEGEAIIQDFDCYSRQLKSLNIGSLAQQFFSHFCDMMDFLCSEVENSYYSEK